MDDSAKRSLLVEFNEEVYKSVLDDTAHFIKEHSADIEVVRSEWTLLFGFPRCSVSECAKTRRHRGRRRRTEPETVGDVDAVYLFYESLYDRVHNFVAHLFEVGLRVDTAALMETVKEEKEDDAAGLTVDKLLAAERDLIASKKAKSGLQFDDDEGTKYTIQSAAEQEGVTLLDAVLQKVAEMEMEQIQRKRLLDLHSFLRDDGFESDSIEMDIEDVDDSNIANVLRNDAAIQSISEFMRSVNCMHSTYSAKRAFPYFESIAAQKRSL